MLLDRTRVCVKQRGFERDDFVPLGGFIAVSGVG